MHLLSSRIPTLQLHSFERIDATPKTALLRVSGAWQAQLPSSLDNPVLLVEAGQRLVRVEQIRGDNGAAPGAHPDPAPWRGAFSVPMDLLAHPDVAFALDTGIGIVLLPEPVAAGPAARAQREIAPPVNSTDGSRPLEAPRAASSTTSAAAQKFEPVQPFNGHRQLDRSLRPGDRGGMMEIGYVISELWRMRRLMAVGLLVAALAAVSVLYQLPSLEKKSYEVGAATTQMVVETAGLPLGAVGTDPQAASNLVAQTGLYARLLSSAPVTKLIAQEAGVPQGLIAASTDTGDPANRSGREIAAEARANELLVEGNGYRIRATPSVDVPFISVYTQAPTAAEAVRLANASVVALRLYVKQIAVQDQQPRQIRFRQLGLATGGMVTQNANRKIAGLAFFGAFIGWALLVLVVSRIIAGWRAAKAAERQRRDAVENVGYLADREGDAEPASKAALSGSRQRASR